jgi:hypothetical protein
MVEDIYWLKIYIVDSISFFYLFNIRIQILKINTL